MRSEQAFVLSMLKAVLSFKEGLQQNPSMLRQPAPIVPDQYRTITPNQCDPGTVLFRLSDKPRFVGIVKSVEPVDNGYYRIEFVNGGYKTIPEGETLYTEL